MVEQESIELPFFKKFGFKGSLWISVIYNFIVSVENSFYIITYKSMQEEFGFSNREYGLLLSLMAIMNLCATPFNSWISTQYPPYKIMGVIMVLSAIGDLLIYTSTGYKSVAIATIPKGFSSPTSNLLFCMFDAYVDPKERIMWVNTISIFGALGGLSGSVLATLLPWRLCYLIGSIIIIPCIIFCFLIDGPPTLPRVNQSVPLAGMIPTFRKLICIPRVWTMMIICNFAHIGVFTQVEYYAKFVDSEYGWEVEQAIYIVGGFWIIGTVSGKYIGARLLDKKKNSLGLVDGVATSTIRDELYRSIMTYGLIPYAILLSSGMFGWHIHSGAMFCSIVFTQCFTLAFFPEMSVQMWSVSLNDVPYIFPLTNVMWNLLHILFAMLIGSLLDAGVDFPTTFLIISAFGWMSFITMLIESQTNWISADYSTDTLDPNLLSHAEHKDPISFEDISIPKQTTSVSTTV